MRAIVRLFCVLGGFFALDTTARATVAIDIDLSSQRMHVTSGGGDSHTWTISSARSGFYTPRGSYHPTRLRAVYRSRKYHNSPMPHSIFFAGGYAIHGTYETRALGRPASHGCIRLSPGAAAKLFSMVRAEGASIKIRGSAPQRQAARRHHASSMAYAPERHSVSPISEWQDDPAHY